jgi:putative intracellular protease/amidase
MTNVLIVLTSHDSLGDTGEATGAYLPEVAHPWAVFTEAGLTVDLASVRGGRPPLDGVDTDDPDQKAFLADPRMAGQLERTVPLGEVDPDRYAAVWLAGGHGTMWDFPGNAEIGRIGGRIAAAGGVVASVCHGAAGLLALRGADGEPLVRGRRVSAFSNREEEAVGRTAVVPFLLQSALEEAGALYREAEPWSSIAVVDGPFVTGQNPQSSREVARAVVDALAERGRG